MTKETIALAFYDTVKEALRTVEDDSEFHLYIGGAMEFATKLETTCNAPQSTQTDSFVEVEHPNLVIPETEKNEISVLADKVFSDESPKRKPGRPKKVVNKWKY